MKLLYWFMLGIFGSGAVEIDDCTGEKDSAVATKGHPFFLSFGYDGPTKLVRYSFTKDGVAFNGDNVRIFLDMDRIFFLQVADSDVGFYTLVVRRGIRLFTKTIRLCGKTLALFICLNF